jgi:hypothetical protein
MLSQWAIPILPVFALGFGTSGTKRRLASGFLLSSMDVSSLKDDPKEPMLVCNQFSIPKVEGLTIRFSKPRFWRKVFFSWQSDCKVAVK